MKNYADEHSRRYIGVEGAYNVRDLGGYPTQDGKTTRWRTLLRGDNLRALSPASQQLLLDYGVRTVIDLRDPGELKRDNPPHVFTGHPEVHYANLPVYTYELARNFYKRVENTFDINRLILQECGGQLKAIIEAIAAGDAPTIFHCSVGKDRTGMVAALNLSLAKVAPEIIAEDYALTARYLEPARENFKADAARMKLDTELHERLMRADAETMLQTLQYLQTEFGGAEAYLKAAGVSAETLEKIRARLVE